MPSRSTLLYQAAVLVALVSQGARAQDDDQVQFTYPDKEGLTFYQRDAVTVSYISDIKNASLWTFCREGESGSEVVFSKFSPSLESLRMLEVMRMMADNV